MNILMDFKIRTRYDIIDVTHTERHDLKIGERHFCVQDEEADTVC